VGPLGPCFNTLRHFLPTHATLVASVPADGCCTACSEWVKEGGVPFLWSALCASTEEEVHALLTQRGRGLPPASAAAPVALTGGGGAAASASEGAPSGSGWIHLSNK